MGVQCKELHPYLNLMQLMRFWYSSRYCNEKKLWGFWEEGECILYLGTLSTTRHQRADGEPQLASLPVVTSLCSPLPDLIKLNLCHQQMTAKVTVGDFQGSYKRHSSLSLGDTQSSYLANTQAALWKHPIK